ncbi:xylulokinase [Caldicoprobacter guelmensis]|uniref:FGGY family carbohydrate kinase n=1 Tax=Caldicoprobacter guelmensis TaxID=1170224 RepID=UPI001959F65E|nr:xylulokinase [Caldicoprobacter guelmensis]
MNDVLVGIDIGTTHCKIGLFDVKGCLIDVVRYVNRVYNNGDGYYYDPEEIWQSVEQGLIKVLSSAGRDKLVAIGITSMAETGLLVSTEDGRSYTPFIPWFDMRATEKVRFIQEKIRQLDVFSKTGLRVSYKHGLPKLIWLKDKKGELPLNVKWLSAADYIAFKLTGVMATDYTLAARTFAYDLENNKWNDELISTMGIRVNIFPKVVESGTSIGFLKGEMLSKLRLAGDIPVCICGHDHLCAAFGAGVVTLGTVLDSMGTAETLVGVTPSRRLRETEWNTGFSFGKHVVEGYYFWMGGLPASGGSVEWIRSMMSDPPLNYDDLSELLAHAPQGPTGILYFPYLAGGSSPVSSIPLEGAFVGLKRSHKRHDVAKAILEGAAYEVEYMRQVAEENLNVEMNNIIAVGGGVQNKYWLNIKANVFSRPIKVIAMPEVALMGAAFLAALKTGYFSSVEEVYQGINTETHIVYPDDDLSALYRRQYKRYAQFQKYLKQYYTSI